MKLAPYARTGIEQQKGRIALGTFQSAALIGASGWAIAILLVLACVGIIAYYFRRPKAGGGPSTGGSAGAGPQAVAAAQPPLTFSELTTADGLREAIAGLGWLEPTTLQARVIPLARKGRDLVAVAPTGSGKTGAYLIPALDRQVDGDGLRTLVLVSTRNAVERVAAEARALAAPVHLWVGELHAGEPVQAQVRDLQAGFDLLIATPGRLLEQFDADNVRLDEVEVLVLDEAERLLEPADRARVERIAAACPVGRQTWVFAGDVSDVVEAFAGEFLQAPARVEAPAILGHGSSAQRPADNLVAVGQDGTTARVIGTVKWFSDTKGFGFITVGSGDKDCFVHYSAIVGDGYRSLVEGDQVAFEIVPTSKGPEAANVVKV